MAKNIAGAKRGFLWDPNSRDLGIYVDGFKAASYVANVSRTYYVNNILGDSGNNGLSWGAAFAQVSEAISASEDYRELGGVEGGASANTNDYVRNNIVVQATGTAYTACATLPNYTDIVGLGATPRGNGGGIVRVDGASSASAMAGSARGLGLYNLQLLQSSAGNFYGLELTTCYRSTFEDMGFVNNPYGGMLVVTGGSIVMNNCHFGMDTLHQAYGLKVTGGGNFNACLLTNCDFHGDTAAVLMDNDGGQHTIFKDCTAIGGDYGFLDTVTGDMGHNPVYVRCYGYGQAGTTRNSAGFKLTNHYEYRTIGCIENAFGNVYNLPATPS